MKSVNGDASLRLAEGSRLDTVQTAILHQYRRAELPSGGLIKPCRVRNLKFFFLSTFSWGERHAEIVTKHMSRRVDRRMVKLLNILGEKNTRQTQINHCWERLKTASLDLNKLPSLNGYESFLASAKKKTGKVYVDRMHDTSKPIWQHLALCQAFDIQLTYFGKPEKESPDEYLNTLLPVVRIITSLNLEKFKASRSRLPEDHEFRHWLLAITESTAESILSKLNLMSSVISAKQLAGLSECAGRLLKLSEGIERDKENTHVKDLLIKVSKKIDKALNAATVKLFLETNLESQGGPETLQLAFGICHACHDRRNRNGSKSYADAISKIFSGFADPLTIRHLQNIAKLPEMNSMSDEDGSVLIEDGSVLIREAFALAYVEHHAPPGKLEKLEISRLTGLKRELSVIEISKREVEKLNTAIMHRLQDIVGLQMAHILERLEGKGYADPITLEEMNNLVGTLYAPDLVSEVGQESIDNAIKDYLNKRLDRDEIGKIIMRIEYRAGMFKCEGPAQPFLYKIQSYCEGQTSF